MAASSLDPCGLMGRLRVTRLVPPTTAPCFSQGGSEPCGEPRHRPRFGISRLRAYVLGDACHRECHCSHNCLPEPPSGAHIDCSLAAKPTRLRSAMSAFYQGPPDDLNSPPSRSVIMPAERLPPPILAGSASMQTGAVTWTPVAGIL